MVYHHYKVPHKSMQVHTLYFLGKVSIGGHMSGICHLLFASLSNEQGKEQWTLRNIFGVRCKNMLYRRSLCLISFILSFGIRNVRINLLRLFTARIVMCRIYCDTFLIYYHVFLKNSFSYRRSEMYRFPETYYYIADMPNITRKFNKMMKATKQRRHDEDFERSMIN